MSETKKKQELKGFLGGVERIGNALPHPVIIFIIMAIITLVAAEIMARAGVSVEYFEAKANTESVVEVVSLLNPEGFRYMFDSAISNLASDAGYVVVPLGGIVFALCGMHPIAGIAAAFAGVSGAKLLKAVGLTGIPLILLFILLTAFINLFIGSASAKWGIMAPIFIPMFMEVGLSPALTQVAYRIADSSTNIISPLMNYFAVIVVFMKQYDEDSGLGTLMSTMLPYSIAFLLTWSAFLVIWMLTGWPLGPEAFLFLS